MSARTSSIGCRVLLGLIVLAWGAPANAFCRTTTKQAPADYNAVGVGCWSEGIPLFWRNACVGYSMQAAISKKVSYEDASNAISTAFTRWTGATCPSDSEGRSRVSIDVRDLGAAECARVEYRGGVANQNVIIFRDTDWPYPKEVLGLTKVNYNPSTGEIYGADMELNTFDMGTPEAPLAIRDPVENNAYDFASVVTHEAGHFLGMAHSDVAGATMFAQYEQGQTNMRYLSPDDVNGICTVYRPDGKRAVLDGFVTQAPQCDPTPRGGYSSKCLEAERCSASSHPAGTSFGWLGGAAVAIGALRRRRERRV